MPFPKHSVSGTTQALMPYRSYLYSAKTFLLVVLKYLAVAVLYFVAPATTAETASVPLKKSFTAVRQLHLAAPHPHKVGLSPMKISRAVARSPISVIRPLTASR